MSSKKDRSKCKDDVCHTPFDSLCHTGDDMKAATQTQLERAFARWQDAVTEHDRARRSLERAIKRAWHQGESQSEIARALGWPRQRVNAVIGRPDEKLRGG